MPDSGSHFPAESQETSPLLFPQDEAAITSETTDLENGPRNSSQTQRSFSSIFARAKDAAAPKTKFGRICCIASGVIIGMLLILIPILYFVVIPFGIKQAMGDGMNGINVSLVMRDSYCFLNLFYFIFPLENHTVHSNAKMQCRFSDIIVFF